MKQHTIKMAQSEYSYYSFIKVSFAGLIRRAPQLTAQSAVHF